ncbi:HTH-type transcriptional regulator TtgR [Mycobacteroides salmoniphilum]|nr:HTH-type transcriptional regulator TtgR [Mycobacteroides salmoniphilum]TDZ87667.1 HTH-type transcriptional regulator TtgR [Mycobacteroides salmoniphilum]
MRDSTPRHAAASLLVSRAERIDSTVVAKRLTRSEAQAQTKARLVESATQLYLQHGFAATSNEQVAEDAGYSRGAVYSNFPSKEALALEVIDRHTEQVLESSRQVLGEGSSEDRLEKFQDWIEQSLSDTGWALLKIELALVARHNSTLNEELAARDKTMLDHVAGVIAQLDDDLELPEASVRDLARLCVAVGQGVAIDSIKDPSSTTDWTERLLAAVQRLLPMRPMLPMLIAASSNPTAPEEK